MNRIEELIKQLCPDGVEFKELNDIAEISNIGVDKKIIKGEKSVMLLNYMVKIILFINQLMTMKQSF